MTIASDDADAGFADRDEVLSFLNELLEAERAGARVTLDSARTVGAGTTGELLLTIQRDEAHWCAVLSRHIKALEGVPSPKVGAFYDKAMAIGVIGERLAFLNRGQGWVVRRLREMLPRLADQPLKADLSAMLDSHEANITRAATVA